MKDLDREVNCVINLNVDFDILAKRITGRRVCPSCGAIFNIYNHKPKNESICDFCKGPLKQRSDDTLKQLEIRLSEYEHLTKPVIDFYTGKGDVLQIDASKSVEEVWEQLELELEKKDAYNN